MLWRNLLAVVLACCSASVAWSAPSLNVRLLRSGDPIVGPVILDSNGNYQWEVLVSPDQTLAAGGNGVVDLELAIRLTGTGLVGASVAVPADWPATHAGPVPDAFGSGFEWLALNDEDEAEGLQFDLANDEVFAGLESINFVNGNSRRVMLIKTAGPSLPTGSPLSARTTTIEWGGAYDGSGLLIQGGVETLVSGSATFAAVPGDMDLNGTVTLSDFTGFVNNFGRVGGWYTGNFNNPNGGPDGTNDIAWLEDYNTIVNNFGRTTPGAGGLGVVPEPMSWALFAVAVVHCMAFAGRVRIGHR